jgi:prevent-host-death family protein
MMVSRGTDVLVSRCAHVPSLLLPVFGEASAALWEAVAGGQPVVLTRDGSPAAVVLDLDSYREAELAVEETR